LEFTFLVVLCLGMLERYDIGDWNPPIKTVDQPCSHCKFPFTYKYNRDSYSCIMNTFGNDTWCSTKTDENGTHIDGYELTCNGMTCDGKQHRNHFQSC
jgi:hypothetical protein